MRRVLSGKRILITGASSGIGRALAIQAAQRGMRSVLLALESEPLQAVVNELTASGAEAVAVVADITTAAGRESAFEVVQQRLGGLDVLVNCAGIGAYGQFVDLPPASLRQIMEVNFFASAEICRLAIPLLTEGSQPLIVNVSSMFGRRGVPDWAAYSASKFALCGFSEALRSELVRFGIGVMLVLPGLTRTNFAANVVGHTGPFAIDLSRTKPPEDVARRILEGMRTNKAELWVGNDARRLLWANRLAPSLVNWLKSRTVRKQYASEIATRDLIHQSTMPKR